MNQKVSIVIPVYRRSDLLARLLSSISDYTEHRPYEIIVVDDGSPDDSIRDVVMTCNQLMDVFYVCNDENSGIAFSRNVGIKKSSGEFICQMDSDTIVSPRWISKLLDARARWTDKHASVAITAAMLSHQVGYFMGRPENPINKFHLIQVESVGTACTLYKRSLIEAIGGYDNDLYNLWSDLDFCKRLNKHIEEHDMDPVPKVVIDPMTVCYHHGWIDPDTGEMKEETEANTRSLDELNDREHKQRHLDSMAIMHDRWGVKHPQMDALMVELKNLS